MFKSLARNSLHFNVLFFLWLIFASALLLTCDIPKEIDFERYMSISQYIYTNHEYLLLHFEGDIYTDKPPLMFWLIALGWHLFGGVNVWWPYLMLCFFSGASVFMTYQIAKLLYSDENKAFRASLFLLTLTFFGMATCELRVDTLLLFFVLLIHYGCLKQERLGFFAIFAGIALGLYVKGPLIFIVGLLPAFLGLWISQRKILFKPIFVSVLLGLIPILFWLIPACIRGGEVFQQDVLFGQIANRASRNDGTIFFYLGRLPGYLFPFALLPGVWVSLYQNIRYFKVSAPAVRYALSGIAILTIIFSLFGQKAMHYLLPTMPLWAIVLADCNDLWLDKRRDIIAFKIFLWVLAGFAFLIWYSQTGKGLQALGILNQYLINYTFYLVTQSLQSWQVILLVCFSVVALICIYKNPKMLLLLVMLLSVLIQINIQVLNQHYFHSRFYSYFHESIDYIKKKPTKFQVFLTKPINKRCPATLPFNDIAPLEIKSGETPNYLISNERCLFFSARLFDATPYTVFIPQMSCAFGVWKMNTNTQKLMEFCAKK